ncbi:hypothetical protein AVEN_199877-1 [Araneus ventricosus]|uniref:Tc1-like transposase DDE domain-containing protein n=1 Tax=Araneus ventricosus TaxID=182803 RepID=A0A4Y2KGB0_ARAVE|nr:hypothetical protein AVEN_199877-1 [Araneus ventricosus]
MEHFVDRRSPFPSRRFCQYSKLQNMGKARENPFQMQPLSLHSQKVTVWCGFTAAFIVGPFFFEEIDPSGPVTCTANGTRSDSLLRNQFIPALQQRGCVDITIFMQGGAPPHIATAVKQLLNLHFGNDRIISRHFPTAWPPRSPDLNPCDFWLWGYLKGCCVRGSDCELAELKNSITQHIHSITTETLRSVVENAVSRFQLIGENGGQHIEHFLSKSKPTSFGFISFCFFYGFWPRDNEKPISLFAFSTVFGLGIIKNRFHFCFFYGFWPRDN